MQKGFNFLKPQVEPPSQWTAVYDWMVGTARVILLTVEVIVIVALVIRIGVDIYSKRLDEDIETYEAVLNNRQEEEFKYRTLQNKSLTTKSAWNGTVVYTDVMIEINKYLPKQNNSISVMIDTNSIMVSGEAAEADIDSLEYSFKNSDMFINTKLSSLETGNQQAAKFTLTAEIKELIKKVYPTQSDENL